MSHKSILEQGTAFEFPEHSLLRDVRWDTTCIYLRKPLMHFDLGASSTTTAGPPDTTSVLLQSAGTALHGAYESLKKCLKRGHWACFEETVQMANQYLGGTWFWYSSHVGAAHKVFQ